jgi:DNA-binding NarL/FixJ family response regulator
MVPTRLMIADDHGLVLLGLKKLIEAQPNWKVVAEAQDGREAVIKAHETNPDVAIIDLGMPGLNGFEVCAQITSAIPNIRVLILSMHETDAVFRRVLGAGARGYVLKSDAPRDLVAAVQALRGNRTFFTARVSQLMIDGFLKPQKAEDGGDVCLTRRQREVVQLIAEGKGNKEVAAALNISEKTAATHRADLMRRINLHSVSEIVRYAIRNNLIQA